MSYQSRALATSLTALLTAIAVPASAQEFTFVHASLNPAQHADFPVNMNFVERVQELSDGRISFKVFDSGALGDERQMVEQMQSGTIATARLTPAALSGLCSGISILNLPFLFTDGQALLDAVQTDEFKAICDDILISAGIRPLSYWWMGVRDLYTKEPVESLEDVQGMKLRVWEDPYVVKAWEDLGTIPTPISFSELYTSLQTGAVDGAEGWAESYNSRSFYEVAPHLTRIGYVQIASTLAISESVWQSLPTDLQAAVQQAADENSTFALETFTELQDGIYTTSAKVATVHEVSDLEAWSARSTGVYETFAAEHPGAAADLLTQIVESN
ncbi:TRAP transporter substrate-binding protein [Silicimonas algicola]|uniref:Tripartite ATP-independent transporter DctP family solute receptor n=1 Tax=Silicimonas algicola TaxID=1826607 RepID=A0A316GBL9_9RHOB|nr:TRAP transporter substrate-binding protein [Silicimonas algicola]AZQ67955.1 TRAP transporter substrate-binding protein [Silicimonas algicola]PWK57605.1 tripartite ATP-independent transporter DctP family solute receptor [Silicimonas algicola]